MDSYGFLGRIYWLCKLFETGLNWFIIISQNLLTSTISMIVVSIIFQYFYEIKAN